MRCCIILAMPTKDKAKQRQYWRDHYHRNKKRYAKERSARQWALKVSIQAFKDVPCKDCFRRFPAVCMDFDHREPKKKKFSLAQAAGYFKSHRGEVAMRRILAEIQKCDVVCANCHRIRTSGRDARIRTEI